MKRLVTSSLFLIASPVLFGAIGTSTVWQVQSTATSANANSGGFDPGATFTVTNLATDTNTANTASPVVSSASYNFTSTDMNHWVYVQACTHWRTDCWFQITSVALNKTTLDRTT